MNLEKRINAFVKLGLFLKQFKNGQQNDSLQDLNERFYADFDELIFRQKNFNGWFERESVLLAIDEISNSLTHNNLSEWVTGYTFKEEAVKAVGVIMAGNIPMVGFHDFLSVLISGNKVKAKLSSDDATLLPMVARILIMIESSFEEKISFVEKLENFDAVIATGSNNTSRYFKQYFGKHPHIIRRNRNSVAIIHQNDTIEDLKPLAADIFQYYGLGCRSVSKLYIPKGYRLDIIFEAFYNYKDVTNNNKYANNYDYNKAVYLLGDNELLDNNFLLLKPDESLASPVGVLHYEFYEDTDWLKSHLEGIEEDLQCIVSSENTPIETFNFGESQCPSLCDYADGVDTMDFLIKLS
ncbi:MAG: acyl-CoA reductase [Vicingaceae bacterium]|nr:acyl-CoA reductase [Vicingaceae bacterium]